MTSINLSQGLICFKEQKYDSGIKKFHLLHLEKATMLKQFMEKDNDYMKKARLKKSQNLMMML